METLLQWQNLFLKNKTFARAYQHKHIDYFKYTDAGHCMYKVSGTYPHWKSVDMLHNIVMVLSCEENPLEFLINSLQ